MPLNYSKWDQLEVSLHVLLAYFIPNNTHSSLTTRTSRVTPTLIRSLSFGAHTSSCCYEPNIFSYFESVVGNNEIFMKSAKFARKRSSISRLRSIVTKFSYRESKRSTQIFSINLHLSLPLFISTPSLKSSSPILRGIALQEMTQIN